MSWWDDITTRMGDALVQPQNPWGQMMPTPPGDRRQMISNALITLGGNLAAGGQAGQPFMASLNQGFQNLAEQGTRRGYQQLQGYMLGSKIQEAQRQNQTREALKKNTALLSSMGLTPELVDMLPADQLGKLWVESARDMRTTRALGGGDTSSTTAAPTAISPSGNLSAGGGGELDPYHRRVATVESPTGAPNMLGSGASGYFGFMPQTAAHYANKTTWGKGMTPQQAIAAINEEVKTYPIGTIGPKQRELMTLITADHDASLGKAGLPVSDANRYATHWFGPGGGPALLRADPNMKVGDWVKSVNWGFSPDLVLKQNNLNPDMKVGDLQGLIRAKMGGGGVTIPPMQTAGVTQPNPGPSPVPSYGPTMAIPGGPPQIAPAPAAGPSPGPQAQATQPVQYPQTAPAAAPRPDYQNDPEIQSLQRTRQQLLAAGGKYAEKIPEIDKAIAARKGQLEGRGFEIEKSQQQGAERARIMRDTEIYKVDVKDAAEYAQGIQSSALKSRSARANIQQLDALLANVDTGRFKETTTDIKRMAKGVGIDLEKLGITDDVPRAEAARALVGQMALQLRDPSAGAGMPGAMSDSDRRFLASMVPGLEATPEGRKLMLNFMTKLHDYNIGMAKEISRYRQSPEWKTNPQGVVDVAQNYAEKNPIFSQGDIDAVTKAKGAAAVPTSPQPEPQAPAAPKAGDIMDGYRFKGGNPADKNSWEKVR